MSAGLQAILTLLNLVSFFITLSNKTPGTVTCFRSNLPPSKSLSTRLYDHITSLVNVTRIVCKLIQHIWHRGMECSLQCMGWQYAAAHARRTQNQTTVSYHLWCGVKCAALTMSLTAAYGNWCAWPSASASVSSTPFVMQSIGDCLLFFQKPEHKLH